ncbi:beta-ketoacyl-ACP synthase III [Desulfocurvus sp.]|uniref:beta-ketoacyl-ACP synthase III n=1 Tax=Desulfocurvus sp. TaxID=2871698 RepID=UPI0025B938A5|nr:beta-ketoacyl-ACP synthase III [Desulfocurvus sp.]MCK9240356.1 ketoacyl-ACP synthase III [Desulfocurvus sp.]
MPAYICGVGLHAPANIANHDLEARVETSDEWIVTRTGIRQRHIAQGEVTSDLGTQAARAALADAGLDAADVTHVICATCTPDSYCPNTATQIARKLDLAAPMALDLNAACSGFLYALQMARALTTLEPGATVLVVAAEVLSSRVNWTDRTTCVLFGDGAGAAVVRAQPAARAIEIVDAMLESDGSHGGLLTILGGGSARPYAPGEPVGDDFFVQMNGREVFKVAVRSMTDVCRRMLERHAMTVDDLDMFVAHQANLRIIEAVGKKLDLPAHKVFANVQRYGNTSAASVGIALAEGCADGTFAPGGRVLLTTFGAGFTWGAVLLQF